MSRPLAALLCIMMHACSEGSLDVSAPPAAPAGQAGSSGSAGASASTGAAGGPSPSLDNAFVEPRLADDLDPDPRVLAVSVHAQKAVHRIGDSFIDGYGFDAMAPGPTLRARVGDTLRLTLTNDLDVPTTIHWHGVDAPYDMDGVTWQRDPVQPGASFTYEFALTHAGTFWYHPHHDSHQQVDLGLYGALVVEDPADPPPDRDLVVVFDAWGEQGGAGATAHDDGHSHDAATDPSAHTGHVHGTGALLSTWTANGKLRPTLSLPGGTRVRARLINASITGYLALRWPGLRHIGSDQGLLAAPATPDRIVLSPGDRADVEWLVGDQGFVVTSDAYSLFGEAHGAPVELLEVAVSSPAPAPSPVAYPYSGAPPSPDPGSTDVLYVMTGSEEGGGFLINGEAYPDITIEELSLGRPAVIEVRNLSTTEHPFHLHGNSFEILSVDGVAPANLTREDTINLGVRQVVRLGITPTNPGDWMAHCHILTHAEGGMMTVLRVR